VYIWDEHLIVFLSGAIDAPPTWLRREDSEVQGGQLAGSDPDARQSGHVNDEWGLEGLRQWRQWQDHCFEILCFQDDLANADGDGWIQAIAGRRRWKK